MISSETRQHFVPCLPEDAHGGVGRHLNVSLVNKHRLETGVRIAARQDLLVELKDLVQVGHGVFEQREQLRQAEVGHLVRTTFVLRGEVYHRNHLEQSTVMEHVFLMYKVKMFLNVGGLQ